MGDQKSSGAPKVSRLMAGARLWGQQNFDDDWRFFRGDESGAEEAAFDDASWRQLDLPHDFSIEGPFDKYAPAGPDGASLDAGIAWYRKSFTLPEGQGAARVFIVRFDGVYMNSDVWINGTHLGLHPYGYTPFEYDLTPYIKTDGTPNVLAVKVNSQEPNSRWYAGAGIYRHVWLITRHTLQVETRATKITTPSIDDKTAKVDLDTMATNAGDAPQKVVVTSTIHDDQHLLVSTQKACGEVPAHGQMQVKHSHQVLLPKLWSIARPQLYTMTVTIQSEDKTVDTFISPFGLRTVRFDANAGMFLNGEHVKIQGVCMHHDLGALGAALNESALIRQLEILKSMGTNAIRTSHNPPAPELLDLCDRMGFVVMDEAFDTWRGGKVANDYHLYFDQWAKRDVQNMVTRDRNHPSVIMWSIGNEIPDSDKGVGVTIAKQLIQWVREEDTTRPITMAENKMGSPYARAIADLLDLVGYNYAPWRFDPDHNEHPAWKIFGSETSSAVRSRGVYHLPVEQNVLSHGDMQCSSYDNSVVAWGDSAEGSWRIDRERDFVMGEFIWTGFDYLGEPTPYNWPAKSSYFGIIDTAGFPKDIYYFYKSQWTSGPMVHVLPHWNWKAGQTVPVFVYASTPTVELFLNDRSLGQKSFAPGDTHLRWDVAFASGTLKAVAKVDGLSVAIDEVKTASGATDIRLAADRRIIAADRGELVFVEASIVDQNQVLVPNGGQKIFFEAKGEGTITAVDNGDAISHEPFQASERSAFSGKALAIVKPTGKPGTIVVSAFSPEGGENLAKGKAVSADSSQTAKGHTPEMALDDDLQTRWCAADEAPGHYWQVDLGAVTPIAASKIVWERQGAVYRYVIDVSDDGAAWHRVIDKSATRSSVQTSWDLWKARARYVRVTVTGLEPGLWASFWEFRLFGSLRTLESKSVTLEAR